MGNGTGLFVLSGGGFMDSSEVIRKKVDNDDGTLTLVFYQGNVEVARTIVDKNYEIINLQGAIPDGIVKQYYDGGTLFTEATYKNNRREGPTFIYRENGPLWIEIPFKDDKAEGISKEFYPDGKLFKATSFRNGKLDGRSCEFYESGPLKVEWSALGGKLEGNSREYYENGALKEEWENVDGKPEGQTKEYFENGQIRAVGNCISGQREGLYREYYESGVIKGEWSFRDGKKEGIAREYFESGEIKYLDTYRRDQRVNRKAYLEYEGHEKSSQELSDVKEIKELLLSQTESYMHYHNQILERIRLVEKRIKGLETAVDDLKTLFKNSKP